MITSNSDLSPVEGATPVRVVFYEPYPMGLGGNFLTQRLILERLDRRRFAPIVVAPADGVALERFRAMGVECVVIPPPTTLGRYGGAVLREGFVARLRSAYDLLRYNRAIARFLRERNVDLVYANCVRAEMSVGFGCRMAGVPSVLYVKGELANPVIDRLCFLLAAKILFFCPQNRDDKYPGFVRWFRQKIDILEIGLDPASIARVEAEDHAGVREELGIDPHCVNTVVLGQLYKPKGQHYAIEAMAAIAGDFPNLRLYLVGDHVIEEYRAYRTELEELVKVHGLEGKVKFTGWRKDALRIVSQMDVLIHPSLAEGFGRAVLESMALGKPVIASAVGGLREAIQDGRNGFLVAPGDVAAIGARWRELLSRPELRDKLGAEARKTVFENYLIDDKVSRLSALWLSVAAARG